MAYISKEHRKEIALALLEVRRLHYHNKYRAYISTINQTAPGPFSQPFVFREKWVRFISHLTREIMTEIDEWITGDCTFCPKLSALVDAQRKMWCIRGCFPAREMIRTFRQYARRSEGAITELDDEEMEMLIDDDDVGWEVLDKNLNYGAIHKPPRRTRDLERRDLYVFRESAPKEEEWVRTEDIPELELGEILCVNDIHTHRTRYEGEKIEIDAVGGGGPELVPCNEGVMQKEPVEVIKWCSWDDDNGED